MNQTFQKSEMIKNYLLNLISKLIMTHVKLMFTHHLGICACFLCKSSMHGRTSSCLDTVFI